MKKYCPHCGSKTLKREDCEGVICPNYTDNILCHFLENEFAIYSNIGLISIDYFKKDKRTHIILNNKNIILPGEIFNLEKIKLYMTYL